MRIGSFGIWELLIILVVVLLIFGPRRLPEMAKGIGQSVREFRKGIKDIRDDITGNDDTDAKTSAASASQARTEATPSAASSDAAAAPASDAAADAARDDAKTTA